ncbi:MAG: hypothetical protein ACXV5F_04350 [Halobacteriota archaeon]
MQKSARLEICLVTIFPWRALVLTDLFLILKQTGCRNFDSQNKLIYVLQSMPSKQYIRPTSPAYLNIEHMHSD